MTCPGGRPDRVGGGLAGSYAEIRSRGRSAVAGRGPPLAYVAVHRAAWDLGDPQVQLVHTAPAQQDLAVGNGQQQLQNGRQTRHLE
jgi:hypothetical protein